MTNLPLSEVRRRQHHPHLDVDPLYSRLVMRRLSPFMTWFVYNFTPLTANAITLCAIVSGVVASALLLLPTTPTYLSAAFLLQFAYLCDTSDGEVARLRGSASKRGTYYDMLGHILQDRALFVAAALELILLSGFSYPVVLLSLVSVAFTEPFGVHARVIIAGSIDDADPVHGARRPVVRSSGSGLAGNMYYAYRKLAFLWGYPAAMNLFCVSILIDAARFAIFPGAVATALPLLYLVFGPTLVIRQFGNALRLLRVANW